MVILMSKSKMEEFKEWDIQNHPEAKEAYAQAEFDLRASVLVKQMREDLGMTQVEFAKLVNKPQSTISRIESDSMNVSIGLLNDIATKANRKLKLVLV